MKERGKRERRRRGRDEEEEEGEEEEGEEEDGEEKLEEEKEANFLEFPLREQAAEKSTYFKLTPRSQTYEVRGQGEKKVRYIQNQRQTNTSHCPTETIARSVAFPLNYFKSFTYFHFLKYV